MSRHFTVVVRRKVQASAEQAFDKWLALETRTEFLAKGRRKGSVKEVNPVADGLERYEERWKNQLLATVTRRYLVIDSPRLIIAHVCTNACAENESQFIADQELILFKNIDNGTELVASSQVTCTKPMYVHAMEDNWNSTFDWFEFMLTN